MWIEIFKTGTHTDSAGRERNFTSEDISAIADKYNQSIAVDKSGEAPIVIGHPKDNTPAYGWVERLARRGEILLAKLKNLSPEIIEQVRQGAFRKVSVSLFPDLMLRHIGLLGAATPAVKGLKNISFAEGENTEIISDFNFNDFSDKEGTKDSDLIEKINFLENENKKIQKKLEEKDQQIHKLIKEAKTKEFREFINSSVKAQNSLKLSPAQSENLVEIMQLVYERGLKKEENTDWNASDFSENEDLLEKIKSFIYGLSTQITTEEFAVRQSKKDNSDYYSFSGRKVQPDRMLLHNRALEIMNENPTLSYEEAIIEAQS
ncbi:MAG: hypothetical protein N2319_07485 [Candidatus Kapabacteria bacterium]|nr:hypothetical protein [Candidatus Kapabacteria bacterium]